LYAGETTLSMLSLISPPLGTGPAIKV
jgi:hypothetical protein